MASPLQHQLNVRCGEEHVQYTPVRFDDRVRVRLRTTLSDSLLKSVGSRRPRHRYPRVPTRTRKYIRYQGDTTDVVHTSASPSEHWSLAARLGGLW